MKLYTVKLWYIYLLLMQIPTDWSPIGRILILWIDLRLCMCDEGAQGSGGKLPQEKIRML